MRKTITLMGSVEIERMRAAGKVAAQLLKHLGSMVKPGITTGAIDDAACAWIAERGHTNAPLGYLGGGITPFPKSICTSVNEVVCHGIPSTDQVLQEGDIINIDVTPIVAGYHGDTSATFPVGQITDEAARLIKATNECLERGIAVVKPGNHVGDIGAVIQAHAGTYKFGVVREFTGHGVGKIFHTSPVIPHFGIPFTGIMLEPGMVFTIEPMLNVGDWRTALDAQDGWTVRTKDGKLSAQAEHTVLVTETGVEILTREAV